MVLSDKIVEMRRQKMAQIGVLEDILGDENATIDSIVRSKNLSNLF